jgi:hypothetical protein
MPAKPCAADSAANTSRNITCIIATRSSGESKDARRCFAPTMSFTGRMAQGFI